MINQMTSQEGSGDEELRVEAVTSRGLRKEEVGCGRGRLDGP